MTDPRILPRESIRSLKGYADEAHGGINLSNNANLFGPNPALAKALDRVRAEDLWDYPSLSSVDLREAIARRLRVPAEGVLVGNGSNDLIDVLIRTFAEPGAGVAYHPPTFAMIPIFVATNSAAPRPVPLGKDFALDADGLAATGARVTFIASPNNPTGNAFAREAILKVAERAAGIVVVDEAYAEFAGRSLLPDLPSHPNLVILRTFSKAYGLAGLRVGYAVAGEAVAREAAKVRGPFRLNAVSELAATLALDEGDWLARVVAENAAERARLADALAARGFAPHPSDANFLLATVPAGREGRALAAGLAARGVAVRDFGGDLARAIRVTIGPRPLMDAFLDRLDAVLKEASA